VTVLAQTFGRLRQETNERRGVRFERVYDYRPDELWAAVTEPEQIRGWLGEADLELREGAGGTLKLDEMTATLTVRRLEPGRLVEYDWNFPDEPPSILRLELEPREKGTLLVLDHRRLAADDAPGYGAGWHSHLDALELLLVGRSHDWQDRFNELHPGYVEQAAELSCDPGIGEVRRERERSGVQFERVLEAEPTRVWDALVEPRDLAVWLGAERVELERRVGGRVFVRWSDREAMEGVIEEIEPPRVLAYTWHERGNRSIVRFELSRTDAGTRIVLDHRGLPPGSVVSFGAGWQSHLDWLGAHLDGREHDFSARYRELTPVYEDLAAAL
jgi:uncharacterized protein YndB with AHSA1/START domain